MLIGIFSVLSVDIVFELRCVTWSKLNSEKSEEVRLQNFSVTTLTYVLASYISSRVQRVCWSGLTLKAVTWDLIFGTPPSDVETLLRVLRAIECVVKYSWLKSTNWRVSLLGTIRRFDVELSVLILWELCSYLIKLALRWVRTHLLLSFLITFIELSPRVSP